MTANELDSGKEEQGVCMPVPALQSLIVTSAQSTSLISGTYGNLLPYYSVLNPPTTYTLAKIIQLDRKLSVF